MNISSLLAALAAIAIAVAIQPPRQPRQPAGNGRRLLSFNDTVVTSKFRYSSRAVRWQGEDGEYVFQSPDDGALVLENIATGENQTLVAADKMPSGVSTWQVRPGMATVLFATNYTKQYRHSYFADYAVLDVQSGELVALTPDQAGDVQYAAFVPGDSETIVFVRGNNIYLSQNRTVTQITHDGGPDIFHGVPDWVYEEEVFGDTNAMWFSPDGAVLAFLSFNETGVGHYRIPYYMENQEFAPSYPRELDLRYPKVGSPNPIVTLSLLFMDTAEVLSVPIDAFTPQDLVVGEVAWMTDKHAALIYRAFNRVQDVSKHVQVDVESLRASAGREAQARVVRERDGTDGWLDNNMAMQYVGAVNGSGDWYVDLSDESGWQHIYLYPVEGGDGVALTDGEWEVTAIMKVDKERRLVHFASTKHHSTERHLYSVSYDSLETKSLVDDSVAASWSASFSSKGGYYILSYQGPDVPYQELYTIESSSPIRTITSNEALWNRIQEYALPNITYFSLDHPDGYSLNVMQRLPVGFEPSKKYPVLFTPYGGPGSQQVSKSFQSLAWAAYIASDEELQFITYTVDGRGTGYQGRPFRSTVTSQLGRLEAEDQIWAARQLISRHSYIDASKIGIWGVSYGGYLSAKVVEADSGVFSLGLIQAPVTDWRFYDSVYTERYMKTYDMNQAGYNESAVRKAQGFKDVAGGFAILHGTGDDNVHYQNSAALVDLLVSEGLTSAKMDWKAFTDSTHGIAFHGADVYLYKYLTSLLYREKLRTAGDSMVHQWSRRRAEARSSDAYGQS